MYRTGDESEYVYILYIFYDDFSIYFFKCSPLPLNTYYTYELVVANRTKK